MSEKIVNRVITHYIRALGARRSSSASAAGGGGMRAEGTQAHAQTLICEFDAHKKTLKRHNIALILHRRKLRSEH